MNLSHTQEIDLALVKRAVARSYVRKRHALRILVRLGVFTVEHARRERHVLTDLTATWRSARAMLREHIRQDVQLAVTYSTRGVSCRSRPVHLWPWRLPS